jgi:hypothetical protein
MSDSSSPFRSPAGSVGGSRVREVKAWVREAARLPEDVTIMVSELACSEPGCPPYEVVMAVLRPSQPPLQRKLHQRLADLSRQDVVDLWSPGAIPEAPHDHPPHDSDT